MSENELCPRDTRRILFSDNPMYWRSKMDTSHKMGTYGLGKKARGCPQGVWGLNQKSRNSISKNKDRVLAVRKELDVQGLISRENFTKKSDDHLTEVMVKPAIKRAPMMDVFSFFPL